MSWPRTATSEPFPAVGGELGRWSLAELMRDGDLLGSGPIGGLERRLAEHYGRKHALCVASATAALFALARAFELEAGEVVTTPYAWGGGVGSLLAAGARVRFADIDRATLALRPDAAAAAVVPATRALLSVDVFGVPADDRALRRVADDRGLYLLHDGAQSFGALREGRRPGAYAHAVVLSLAAGKALNAGEGGVILTDDTRLFERLVELTQHPLRRKREVGLAGASELALHSRMHPAAAAWALVGFDAALARVTRRQRAALRALAAAEATGLCELQGYSSRGVLPAFHRISAAWSGRPAPAELERQLRSARAGRWRVAPSPVRLIPDDPRLDEYPGAWSSTRCPEAEHQVKSRFILEEEEVR